MKLINVSLSDEQVNELIRQVINEFGSQSKTGFDDGVFDFKLKLNSVKLPKAKLTVSETARQKMYALVDGFDSEVAWYMKCTKGDESYTVDDVWVYPQKVSSVYVEMDMEKYPEWDISLPDDVSLNGQGHSHHTMAVSPSGTDKDSQKSYVGYLNGRGFYIFCIINRKRDENWWIYDLDKGVIYEPEDITVTNRTGYEDFVKAAKDMVSPIKHEVSSVGSNKVSKSDGGKKKARKLSDFEEYMMSFSDYYPWEY